jgi:hypothetical protein
MRLVRRRRDSGSRRAARARRTIHVEGEVRTAKLVNLR